MAAPPSQPMPHVFIVDESRTSSGSLHDALASRAQVRVFASAADAALAGSGGGPPIVVAGLGGSLQGAVGTLRALCSRYPECVGILVADYEDYMRLDPTERLRDNFLLACRPIEMNAFIKNVERAIATARMREQLKSMRSVS